MNAEVTQEAPRIRRPSTQFGYWQIIAVAVVTCVVTSAVQWGLYSARTDENSRRIEALELQLVPRGEFEELRGDLRDRMVRIENKLDRIALEGAMAQK